MKIIDLSKDNFNVGNLDITIGAYDGIHDGHLKVIEKLVNDKISDSVAVFTFNTHPDFTLNKRENFGIIVNNIEKANYFSTLGVDYLCILPDDILKLTPYEFNKYLKSLNVKRVVVGSDFIYGAGGAGNVETLSQDFIVDKIDLITYENKKLSSTEIRELLTLGKIEEVNKLLKTDFIIKGLVTVGSQIGARLGFPTANLEIGDKYYYLRKGVYLVNVKIGNECYRGLANFGYNPSINKVEKPRLEVHILDFNKDLYNQEIEVSLIKFIRDEKTFKNKEELIKQIKIDIESVK